MDGKTGPVKLGDRFRLINLWGPSAFLPLALQLWGVYYDGYSVNTVKINSSNYNNNVSHWFIGEENIEQLPVDTIPGVIRMVVARAIYGLPLLINQ